MFEELLAVLQLFMKHSKLRISSLDLLEVGLSGFVVVPLLIDLNYVG